MSSFAVPPTVVDFLSECAFDLQADRLQPLGHYLARYPGHSEAVAREYLALIDVHAPRPTAARSLGRYELLRELARGGQGRVHLARDPVLGRFAAVKVLELTGGTDASRRERLRREVDAVVRLDHPYVCRLLEADVDHTPPYVAMELVPGRSLADLLALGERANAESGGLIEPRGRAQLAGFAQFFERVAAAVHTVHDAGLVHRDLKPANLMVTPEGEPRVLDFGLASPAERIGEVTMTDALVGTLPFMAPEQLIAGARVDRRVDVFALGLTMLECALRERPFDGLSPVARLESIQVGVPWRVLRRVSADLRAILARALAAQPERRYATCQELADDLRRWQERRPVRARRTGRLLVTGRWCARHPWSTSWLVATAIAVAATWYAVGAERDALVVSQRYEAGILDAVRSFDPWGPGGGADALGALETLRDSFVAGGETRQRLAMVEIRRGGIEAARSLLDQPDVPQDERTAALRFACQLLARPEDDDAPRPVLPTLDLELFAARMAEIAGELYRHGAWESFDVVTQGALACFDTPELMFNRYRLALVLWQVQAACVRRKIADALLFDDEKRRLIARHGRASDEVADAEELFLRTLFQVVPGQFLIDTFRTRARNGALTIADQGSVRAIRQRAFAIAVDTYSRPETVAELETLRDRLHGSLGAEHPDVIRTNWLFSRWLAEFHPQRRAELLVAAWAGAVHLPSEDEELQANVRRDYTACREIPLDAAARAHLGAEVLRQHLRLWGAGDPRTQEALSRVPLDPERTPEVWVWRELALARVPVDEPGRERRDRILTNLLRQSIDTPRTLAAEQYALALQEGGVAISLHAAREARGDLARLWLRTHERTRGEGAIRALSDSVRSWRQSLGASDPGEGFLSEMLLSVGKVHLDAWALADSDLMLQAAVHAAARELGTDDRDWLEAAESLPTSERRFREILVALAQLNERLGRDDAVVRMWRRALPDRSLFERWGGTYFPARDPLRELAWALVRSGDYAGAERELERCLEVQAERMESAEEVARTHRALLELYIVSDQPVKAAEQRRLLGG